MYQDQREHKVVIALISERDYDVVQSIVAWPIKYLGIFLVAVLFSILLPAIGLIALALFC